MYGANYIDAVPLWLAAVLALSKETADLEMERLQLLEERQLAEAIRASRHASEGLLSSAELEQEVQRTRLLASGGLYLDLIRAS